ncbi:hypothetical protein E4T56_gene2320, partial [Termitomyces sp. T112]
MAAATGLALIPAIASAGEEAAPQSEETNTIVVRGFGHDVASFPDTNLAEAIQRVPGVAITRDAGGEGRQVSLRGFTPDYTL